MNKTEERFKISIIVMALVIGILVAVLLFTVKSEKFEQQKLHHDQVISETYKVDDLVKK